MEKVETPTIYFTKPKKHSSSCGISFSRDFWTNFSQSQLAATTITFRAWDSKRKFSDDKVEENYTQNDHINQSPAIIITPRQNHRSNAKLKLQFKWCQVFLLICILTLSLFCQVSEECPVACECKWKGGKESVICQKLTAIPRGIDPGTQLLDLSKNNIQILQSKVFHALNLVNLQKIFLSECNLKTLEKNTFYKLNNCVELDLSGNKLESIPTHTFPQLPELRELKMTSNPVTRISSNAFSSLTRLVRLELSRCRIQVVDSTAFRGLVSLEWLKLDNNQLSTIHVSSLYPLRNLHGLEIHENPWNCSCTLQPLRDWMSKNNVPLNVEPVCSEPLRLLGKSWDSLQREDFACLPKVQNSVLAETGDLTKAIEGENATLICRLQATADTQVRWMAGNKQVSPSSSSRYSVSESFLQGFVDSDKTIPLPTTSTAFSGAKQTIGTKTSRLTVIRTKLRDSGTYSCRAQTRAGSVSTNFTLQVFQINAEHHSGRFLLYGATVAALLTLSVCLLLLCVVFYCGKQKSRILTGDKIELNYVAQNGRLPQNGHGPPSRNGSTSIPLLQTENHSHNSNGTPNHRPRNSGIGVLSNFNIMRRPLIQETNNTPSNRGLLNPQYKALQMNDDPLDANLEPDSSSDIEDNEMKHESAFSTCNTKNSKAFVAEVPSGSHTSVTNPSLETQYPDLISEEKSSDHRNSDIDEQQTAISSVRSKALLPLQMTTSANPSKPQPSPEFVPKPAINSHKRSNSESIPQPPMHSYPKLISNGSNLTHPTVMNDCNTSTVSIPSAGSNSSNSNLSKNESLYGSTSTYQTMLSTSPVFTKFTFTQKPPPPIPAPRHQRTSSFSSGETTRSIQNPNHISYYRQPGCQYSTRGRPPFQRRSMPTSPIHFPPSHHPHTYDHPRLNNHPHYLENQGSDPGLINQHDLFGQSQEYDYHASQLAAFLEEYRQLQMELMRMSASLTEMDPTTGNNTNSNINLNAIDNSMTQHRVASSTNANVDFHQQQFKSILKSSGPNNNYLV